MGVLRVAVLVIQPDVLGISYMNAWGPSLGVRDVILRRIASLTRRSAAPQALATTPVMSRRADRVGQTFYARHLEVVRLRNELYANYGMYRDGGFCLKIMVVSGGGVNKGRTCTCICAN